MQVLQLIMTELSGRSFHWLSTTSTAESSCHFLCQELSHLLLYITHMFQSGRSLCAACSLFINVSFCRNLWGLLVNLHKPSRMAMQIKNCVVIFQCRSECHKDDQLSSTVFLLLFL